MSLSDNDDHRRVTTVARSSSQMIVAGPPCEGNSENGGRRGTGDERAEVLERCVDWAIKMAWDGMLVVYAFENSRNMRNLKNSPNREKSYADSIRQKLEVGMPFFVHDLVDMDLTEVLAHQRVRLWFRGMRADAVPGRLELPPPLKLPLVTLELLLDRAIPCFPVSKLTVPKRTNLGTFLTKIRADMANGKAGRIACIEIDRSSKCVWTPSVYYDKI